MKSFERIPYEDFKSSELSQYTDLASSALGSTIVAVTNEFFAPATNMINPAPPIHAPGKFVDTGAWMDGWESQRHNSTYDWCIIKLGFAGAIHGFDIDTSYFTGNQAPAASVEGAFCVNGDIQSESVQWTEILPKVDLPPTCHNLFKLSEPTQVFTHLRLNNIPDGGIARFRVYGNVSPIWPEDKSALVDLAFVGNGARAVHVSNQHYTPGSNILLPGRGQNMGDGWETKRSRTPGHSDHVVVRLGDKGHILKVEIDTSHYCGNYPNRLKLEAVQSDAEVPAADAPWSVLLDENTKVGPHGLFFFDPAHTDKVFSHARITIIPDGGLKRLRLYGIREGGAMPSLPITLPKQHQKAIIAEPLTAEKYAMYGDVIEARQDVSVTGANQGTAEKFHHVAQVTNDFPQGGKSNLCVYHCRPAKELPFTVKLLERHPYSNQIFVPMSDGKSRGYLVVVALNGKDDKPDMSTLKAYIASSTQGINYRAGVWHHPMIALENETDFACLVHESGIPEQDCNEVDVEHVVVEVPGF